MLDNITRSYTLSDASWEIAIMLIGAFILWWILGWLLKPSKQYTKKIITPLEVWSRSNETYRAHKIWKGVEAPSDVKVDNLQLIEGIGPKIEKHLQKHGVTNFSDVQKEGVVWLENILLQWWSRLKMHSPTTWPDQAKLAHEWKWKELEEYQDILNGWRKK